jgi:hypothetical protein
VLTAGSSSCGGKSWKMMASMAQKRGLATLPIQPLLFQAVMTRQVRFVSSDRTLATGVVCQYSQGAHVMPRLTASCH